MYKIVNDLPEEEELFDYEDYRFRTYYGRLIKYYPGEGADLDQADMDFAAYMYSGYVENNPGYDTTNKYISYVGIYINEAGEYSGTWKANTQVEQF
jgi:hypothetical protein